MAASYGAPGVYIEEVASGSMPIEGVGTAVAAFVGFTKTYNPEHGEPGDPIGVKPQLVTSWEQFERVYGGFVEGAMLPFAVNGFFSNGGTKAFIVRVPSQAGPTAAPQAMLPSGARPELPALEVRAIEPGARIDVVVERPGPAAEGQEPPQEFTIKVIEDGRQREEFGGLTVGRGPRGAERVVNEQSQKIRISVQAAPGVAALERIPAAGTFTLQAPVGGEVAIRATPADFEGSVSDRTGYQGLAIAEQVTMVAVPDLITIATKPDGRLDVDTYLAVQGRLVDWCESSHTRMAILDSPPGITATQALEWRTTLGRDSAFGVAYYPHLVVSNPLARADATPNERFIAVPPSGHVAGVWARTDATRGVWKAPANEVVRGILRLERDITMGEQDLLNPQGINCIRAFGTNGLRIWGSRTLSASDPSWRYVPVRRLFNFIEESIRQGTQWAVFEPNDENLWLRVKRNINAFLRQLWRAGALVGATPEQAFYVRCDESNNPPDSVDAGRLIVEVGISPVKPAEFVIFRIAQWQGGGETTE